MQQSLSNPGVILLGEGGKKPVVETYSMVDN
jgi:hypothetical protein